jgi:uncharacterized protein YndB with AHSA1/START domain
MTKAKQAPVAKAQTMIRKPVAEVFEALVDPAITSRFWFSRSSGRLEAGKHIRWDWEMYGVSTEVDVKAIEPNARILVEWNGPENPSSVEWTLESRREGTFVVVRNYGFHGSGEDVVQEAIDSTEGFTWLLAGLKAFLEHGIELNAVVDHDPSALVEGWSTRKKAS